MIMKVNVHAVNFTVDRKLVDFVQVRMDKLEKYYDKVVSSDVFMKVEKTSDKENKIVEVKINSFLKSFTLFFHQKIISRNINLDRKSVV